MPASKMNLRGIVILSQSRAQVKNLMQRETESELLRRGVYPEPPSTTLRTGFGRLRTGSVTGLLRMTPLSITRTQYCPLMPSPHPGAYVAGGIPTHLGINTTKDFSNSEYRVPDVPAPRSRPV